MSQEHPAGWYPQPDGSQRYWDGSGWTDQVTTPTQPLASILPYESEVAGYQGAHGPVQQTYGQSVYGAHPGQMMVSPKNPALSLLASFFLPGLGSMINGDVGKGIGILCGYLVSAVLVLILIGFFGLFGFWIWGMVDAYQGAQKWNARHGILS